MPIDPWDSFASHPLDESQLKRVEQVRLACYQSFMAIRAACPETRERSIAITKIEEACMWAVKSIALEGK